MKLNIIALASAAALTLGAVAPAAAQGMGQGFDMLQSALMSEFERLNIDINGMEGLTLGELAIIKTILDSDEAESQKKGRIEAILQNN